MMSMRVNVTQVSFKKSVNSRNSVKITNKNIVKIQSEIRQYFDKNGFLSWSERKRKYIILGTNVTVNGLVDCPQCHIGKLLIIRSRQTLKRFIGCSNYRNGCTASSPLIQKGIIYGTKSPCKICSWPVILLRYSRKQKWIKHCSNIRCEGKITKS